MTRQEFEAIVKEVNEAKCYSVYQVEDVCTLFIAAKPKLVAKGLDVDKHRWYEITTDVYKIGEWFIGICGASDLFSEQMSYSDAEIETIAFEMEEVPSVSYRIKQTI